MTSLSYFDDIAPAGGGRLTAVLGPTNTGKTHYALERMLAHKSGMIGLPLRLLAREIYDRIVAQRGGREVALVTGEEKIIPPNPRYWVATVEAMPLERDVEFMAIDEIQVAADPERGRVFTSRLLHARGTEETLLLGSDTMRPILARLFRNIQFLSRTRFSRLTYAGSKKLSRLPRRTAIVAFSSDSVYAIAELIRRQRGGAAVVLGALSPRTRNAQAELYQSGEVDFLIATDAIGMGLNMDIDQVAFAAKRKFDGRGPRDLRPAELAQIAGRAGRHIRDGEFGVTADCPPFDEEIAAAIEDHEFDPVTGLQWRTERLDFTSLHALSRSLARPPPRQEFWRSQREDDEDAFSRLSAREEIRSRARGGAALALLWDICQVPDFRKLGPDPHARLLSDIYEQIIDGGRIDETWMAPQIESLDRIDGDIDALSSRIAHIRTWTFLSHRSAWLGRAPYWQERARAIEDRLSDALHEKLTQRFVDRRTSALIKRLKDDAPLLAGVTDDGEVIVEGQFIGRLLGFEFIVDPRATGAEAKSLRAAGEKALRPVLAARAAALANASPEDLRLAEDGMIWWRNAPVGQLQKGPAPLRPDVVVRGLDDISANMRGRVEDRIKDFVSAKIEGLLGPLIALQTAANTEGDGALKGVTRGVAYRLVENFGATSRSQFGEELKQLEQEERAKLRKLGMRFGEFTLYVPAILKPAPARLLILLWTLWTDRAPHETPPPKAGLVSLEANESLPHAYYYAAGYRPSGTRAVRIDMLERLAGLIRTARNDADMREGFEATPQMMSLVGCSGEDFEGILRSLGFRKNVVKRKPAPPQEAQQSVKSDPASPSETTAPESADEEPETPAAAQAPISDAPAEAAPDQPSETAVDIPSAGDPETEGQNTVDAQPTAETPNDVNDDVNQAANGEETHALEAAKETDAAEAKADTTTETASEELVEVALWRPAPRRPKRDARPAGKNAQNANEGRGKKGKGQRGDFDRNEKKGRGGKPQGKPKRPPREKRADPDSPFAVLAALKSELSGSKPPEKSKSSEKAK